MHVCDNVGDHLIGNVYARYDWEEDTAKAVDSLNSRWYAGQSFPFFSPIVVELTPTLGRPCFAELSPVTDFREACCRQNDTGECSRGGFCNFMHLRHPSKALVKDLQRQQKVERRMNPDPREEERRKELEAFNGGHGGRDDDRRGGGGGRRDQSPRRR